MKTMYNIGQKEVHGSKSTDKAIDIEIFTGQVTHRSNSVPLYDHH